MRISYFLKISFIFFLIFIFPTLYTVCFANSSIVRVNIIENAEDVLLYVSGETEVLFPYTNKKIGFYANGLKSNIIPVEHGIRFKEKTYKIFGLQFKPLHEDKIFVNNIPYKGEVLIFRTETNKLSVINYITISNYLKGVLINEISDKWPEAAIKAQAVSARTYTMYRCLHAKYNEYDLKADVTAQVYRGSLSERVKTNLAVEDTKGQVLIYDGKLIPAFYHACCGGHTASADDVWGVKLSVFKGIRDNFCKKSPHFKWTLTLSISDLTDIMEKAGSNVGKILDIFVINYNKFDRIDNMFIIGDNDSLFISAEKLRKIIGLNKLKSTKFTLKKLDNNRYQFNGYGWGHGVGMCQWGAYFMAQHGYNYKQILDFYYPGVEIQITEDR